MCVWADVEVKRLVVVNCHRNVDLLTTDDECIQYATLTGCYQLVQSVSKIGSALAERVGQGRWVGVSLSNSVCSHPNLHS